MGGAYLCYGTVRSGAQSVEMDDALAELISNSPARTWSPGDNGDLSDTPMAMELILRGKSAPL